MGKSDAQPARGCACGRAMKLRLLCHKNGKGFQPCWFGVSVFLGLASTPESDAASIEPKVIAAKEHRPSHAPRRVTVERKRRAYEALDIEQLLLERGINYRDASFENKSWLEQQADPQAG